MTPELNPAAYPEPNLWRTVSVHGQPPPNTLIDVLPIATSHVSTMLTGDDPVCREGTKWRLSDLPPLDAIAPPPAPERPEPKFKVGDRVICGCTAETCGKPDILTDVYWSDTGWLYSSDREVHYIEAKLIAAPEPPSIPIGGWFDPGDDFGGPHQREECPAERDRGTPDDVWAYYARGQLGFLPRSMCTPLSEREAMERLYPVGTWLKGGDGISGVVRKWRDEPPQGVACDVGWVGEPGHHWQSARYVREDCTVLPGPPLPAPWQPRKSVPTDGTSGS